MTTPTSSTTKAFRATLDLFEVGVELMRQNLRRERPHRTEEEVDEELRRWLRHRPGAEIGDAPGRLVKAAGDRG